ncbi:MAG: TonB-dependent receptor [Candidatus Cloacimonetes bacterium]|nr:TonB-dependent receptor [Candidatus Cloacimonadota bacterium]
MRKIMLLLLLGLWSFLQSTMVTGYISDSNTGEPIRFATVIEQKTLQGVQSNRQGYYSLSIKKKGKFILQFSQISYKTVLTEIAIDDIDKDIEINVKMEKASVEVQGIQVLGEFNETVNSREIKVGRIFQKAQELGALPQVAESDLIRSLMALPGVTPISDFSNGMYVRGGSPDQNLIRLDDTDIYNPAHFGGIFSTFSTDAIDTVELLKGGYPAIYGGRLSSVLNITNRDGNRKEFKGVARLSMISASTTLEGPWHIGRLKGSWMGSFRRTYVDAIKSFFDGIPDYYFYDAHGKLNLDVSKKDKTNVSWYTGEDKLMLDVGAKMEMSWGNSAYTGQWTHIFNPGIFGRLIVSHSHFQSIIDVTGDDKQLFLRKNMLDDVSVKGTISQRYNNHNTADYGFESKFMNILFKTDSDEQYDSDSMPYINCRSITNSIFYHHNYTTDNFWTFEPGIRVNWYKTLDISLEKSPDREEFDVAPRFSIKRQLDFNSNVYFSIGKYYQYLALASADQSSPLDLWFPIEGTVKPSESEHYILGYKRQLNDYFAIESEVYYKNYRNLVEYDPVTDYIWNNSEMTMEDAFYIGDGHTIGTDFQLRNDWRGLQGFVAYTFGMTKRKMDDFNYNPNSGVAQDYYPKYDRNHQVNLVENFNLTELTGKHLWGAEFKIGSNFSYYTGQPTNSPEEVYFDGEQFHYLYSYADRDRLPDYVRLDLNLKLKWYKKGWTIEPYIEVINALNHENVWSRSYIGTINEDTGISNITYEDSSMFPFLPFLGLNIEF